MVDDVRCGSQPVAVPAVPVKGHLGQQRARDRPLCLLLVRPSSPGTQPVGHTLRCLGLDQEFARPVPEHAHVLSRPRVTRQGTCQDHPQGKWQTPAFGERQRPQQRGFVVGIQRRPDGLVTVRHRHTLLAARSRPRPSALRVDGSPTWPRMLQTATDIDTRTRVPVVVALPLTGALLGLSRAVPSGCRPIRRLKARVCPSRRWPAPLGPRFPPLAGGGLPRMGSARCHADAIRVLSACAALAGGCARVQKAYRNSPSSSDDRPPRGDAHSREVLAVTSSEPDWRRRHALVLHFDELCRLPAASAGRMARRWSTRPRCARRT